MRWKLTETTSAEGVAPVGVGVGGEVLHDLVVGGVSIDSVQSRAESSLAAVLDGHGPRVSNHVVEVSGTHILLAVEQRQSILQALLALLDGALEGTLNVLDLVSTLIAGSGRHTHVEVVVVDDAVHHTLREKIKKNYHYIMKTNLKRTGNRQTGQGKWLCTRRTKHRGRNHRRRTRAQKQTQSR